AYTIASTRHGSSDDDLHERVTGERRTDARALRPVLPVGAYPVVPHVVHGCLLRKVGEKNLDRQETGLIRTRIGQVGVDRRERSPRLGLNVRARASGNGVDKTAMANCPVPPFGASPPAF